MKKRIEGLLRGSLPKFLLVGLAGTGTNLLIFFLLADMGGWGATRSSIVAFVVSVTQNYLLNHRFSFTEDKDRRLSWLSLIRYVSVNLAGLGVSLLVLNALLLVFFVQPKVLAQFLGVGAGTVLNYWGAKKLVFSRRIQETKQDKAE